MCIDIRDYACTGLETAYVSSFQSSTRVVSNIYGVCVCNLCSKSNNKCDCLHCFSDSSLVGTRQNNVI